jgi:hypothetical protein
LNPTDEILGADSVFYFVNPTLYRSGVCGHTTGLSESRGVISNYDFSIPDRQFLGGFLLQKKGVLV